MNKNFPKLQSNKILEKWERLSEDYMVKREKVALKEKAEDIPRKKHYRMRAHCNVLSDTPFPFPLNPDWVDLTFHYPQAFQKFLKVDDFQRKKEELFLNSELTSEKPSHHLYRKSE